MIRFIIETYTSKSDTYGNQYHFATVTSAQTGKHIHITHVGGPSNIHGKVKSMLNLDWPELHSTNIEYPIRRWNEVKKWIVDGVPEHKFTADILAQLEQKDAQP